VLFAALAAGGATAMLVGGREEKKVAPPPPPVAKLKAVDLPKYDIDMGAAVTCFKLPENQRANPPSRSDGATLNS
jgi:hypothetical protein